MSLDTGQVLTAALTFTVDMDLVFDKQPAQASGTLEIHLTRKVQ